MRFLIATRRFAGSVVGLGVLAGVGLAAGCGSKGSASTSTSSHASSGAQSPSTGTSGTSTAGSAGTGGASASTGANTGGASTGTSSSTSDSTATSTTSTSGTSGTSGTSSSTSSTSSGGTQPLAAGWLYTSGAKIMVADGKGGGSQWMGRGVNLDDIFLCEYNYKLWMGTMAEQALTTMIGGLLTGWKPSFVRISLSMASDPTVTSWLTNAAQYKTPMTNVIQTIGATPNTYVLVTLRSDATMIGQDMGSGDAEATGLPSDATTTPDKTNFPTGTDAVYTALVDTFANDAYVLFGLTNEPGGNTLSNATIAAAMSHAVSVIRAEEDKLGVPHHLVSVQGNGWTSDISFYAQTPLSQDNVIYEVHGYPPVASSYTYSNIPVILGEYGSLPDAATFYADVESKQIPNMAWDFESYSDCAPDLLQVNQSSTNLQPSTWGMTVQQYLLAH